jgi:hypothetical protein
VYPSRQYLPAKVRLFLDTLTALVAAMLPLDVRVEKAPRRAARTRR